jgi:NgoBV restriction endonuclease.
MDYVEAKDIIGLLQDRNIGSAVGQIKMSLNNTEVVIKQNDIIGNALQEWLGQFLKEQNIYFRSAKGQTFPDFYLTESDEKGLCEMKTYYATRNAAFDVANYFGYVDSLKEKPWRLDSDYLIFAYISDEDGNISIQDMWCKKVWEITGKAQDFALKCQRKKGQIYNIRPANWKENSRGNLKPFTCKEEFVAALYKTHLSESNQTKVSKAWLDEVVMEYHKYSGEDMYKRLMEYVKAMS